MINCRLFLEKHFPHLAENFIVLTSPSVSSLVTQLDDMIKKLQLVHQKELPEILVEIEFQAVSNLNESDVHALSNFVVAKTDILFCFRVLQSSCLSAIVQENYSPNWTNHSGGQFQYGDKKNLSQKKIFQFPTC